MKKVALICTKCKKTFPIDQLYLRCDVCGEPVEVEKVTKGKINKNDILTQSILERYADFFTFTEIDKSISLREGFTPLISSPELASESNIKNLFLKNEAQNPTWSFKDRGTLTGIQHAISLGYERIGVLSTGNMAASLAAYGKRAGLKTFILVSSSIPSEKLNPIAIYNPILIKVDVDYGTLYYNSLKIGKQHKIYFINSDAAFRIEGYKTISYEICEQLHFDAPDYVVFPTSSGGGIRGFIKGFEEFRLCGLIDKMPKIISVQAIGCAPIYKAYISNAEVVSRVKNPNTIAHAIENPYPPSGNALLRKIRELGGTVVAVTDEEITQAQSQLLKNGIFAQPAAATPLAAVTKLSRENFFNENDTVVCTVTSSGFKDTSVFDRLDLEILESKSEDLSDLIRSRL